MIICCFVANRGTLTEGRQGEEGNTGGSPVRASRKKRREERSEERREGRRKRSDTRKMIDGRCKCGIQRRRFVFAFS